MRLGSRIGAALRICVALGMVAAQSGARPVDQLLLQARAVVREHPDLWRTASVARSGHAVAVGAPRTLVAELASLAERGSRTVARVWGRSAEVVVLVPTTVEQAAALAAPTPVAGLAAVAGPDRIIVEPSGFARLSPTGRQVVITHELTHVATGAATTGHLPLWLVEGFADYVGFRDSGLPVAAVAAELDADLRAGYLPRSLPEPARFTVGSPRRAQAYQEAWLACRFIAERYGERQLVAFYRAAVRSGIATALRGTLGVTAEDLTRQWQAYLHVTLGPRHGDRPTGERGEA